jgi:hypothetical protein
MVNPMRSTAASTPLIREAIEIGPRAVRNTRQRQHDEVHKHVHTAAS